MDVRFTDRTLVEALTESAERVLRMMVASLDA